MLANISLQFLFEGNVNMESYFTPDHECDGEAKWKVSASPDSVGCILWKLWTSVQSLTSIPRIHVEQPTSDAANVAKNAVIAMLQKMCKYICEL